MTTLYDAQRGALNVTLLECAPNVVSLRRTADRDGYTAVQLEAKSGRGRALRREFRWPDEQMPEVSAAVTLEQFQTGDLVDVTATSKAKGFQGVMKRHGFAGAPATHGRKHDHRKPGSIGASFPEHVIKGKRMAGRMGGKRATT